MTDAFSEFDFIRHLSPIRIIRISLEAKMWLNCSTAFPPKVQFSVAFRHSLFIPIPNKITCFSFSGNIVIIQVERGVNGLILPCFHEIS